MRRHLLRPRPAGALAVRALLATALAGCAPVVQRQDVDRAVTMTQAGDHKGAEESLRELLARASKGPMANPDDALLLRSKLIPLVENQGRLGEAIELAQDVHQQWLARRGERAPNTIAALSNLGRLYAAVGRTQLALEAQEKSTRMAIEVLGSWHETSVAARNNLAATYVRLGRLPEAIRLQEVALDASRRVRGENHVQTLVAMSNLGRTYLSARRIDQALQVSRAAAQGLQQVAGPGNPYTLVAVGNQVAALAAAGDLPQALPAQQGLVDASLRAWGERHRFTLEQLATLARLYARAGRPAEALGLAERFVAGAEQVRVQPGLAREDRQSMFAGYADDYRFFSALQGSSGRLAEGFRLAELSKARTLLESISELNASRSNLLPPEQQARLMKLEQALQEHEKALSEAADAATRGALLIRRDAELRNHEALVAELKGRHPKFAQLRDPRLVAAQDLPGLVPAGAVFVGYGVRGDLAVAWTVDEIGALRFHDLGEIPRLADSVDALRRVSSHLGGFRELQAEEGLQVWKLAGGGYTLLPARNAPPDGATLVTRAAELSGYLTERLVAPLAPVLRGRRTWIVSPDGPLAQLPMELLSLDGRRVLEAADVHYVQSLSVYALMREQQRSYQGLARTRDLLALGNPDYVADGESASVRRSRLRSQPIVSEHQLKEARMAWAPLPGTEVEVLKLQALMPNSDVYLKRDASESRLLDMNRRGDLRHYRYLHFAVHGHLSADEPSLSSLVLTQTDLAAGTDGYVTAAEWAGYDLRSDLTVLSACDTGLGRVVSGEGVMGLPYALFVAGNVNTILSLWPVLDEAAPAVMEKLFRRIRQGMPAARALSETKRETARDPKTQHPANWAPFILVGAG